MAHDTNHVYFEECTFLGLFSWQTNLSVELAGIDQPRVTIADEVLNGTLGMHVEVAGKGQCFVTHSASVKAVRKYIRSTLKDGKLDAKETRVLRHMADDLLDGQLDGKCHQHAISEREYRRVLHSLQVA